MRHEARHERGACVASSVKVASSSGSIVQYFHAVPTFHEEATASAQASGWST